MADICLSQGTAPGMHYQMGDRLGTGHVHPAHLCAAAECDGLAEVHCLGLDLRTVPYRLDHAKGKLGFVLLSALGTDLDFALMLGHFQPYREQIERLASLNPICYDLRKLRLQHLHRSTQCTCT